MNNYKHTKVKELLDLLTVIKDPMNLSCIKKPSKAVIFEAISRDGYAIKFVEKQTTAMQLLAIHENIWAYQHLINPSDKVRKKALSINKDIVHIIENEVNKEYDPILA